MALWWCSPHINPILASPFPCHFIHPTFYYLFSNFPVTKIKDLTLSAINRPANLLILRLPTADSFQRFMGTCVETDNQTDLYLQSIYVHDLFYHWSIFLSLGIRLGHICLVNKRFGMFPEENLFWKEGSGDLAVLVPSPSKHFWPTSAIIYCLLLVLRYIMTGQPTPSSPWLPNTWGERLQ